MPRYIVTVPYIGECCVAAHALTFTVDAPDAAAARQRVETSALRAADVYGDFDTDSVAVFQPSELVDILEFIRECEQLRVEQEG